MTDLTKIVPWIFDGDIPDHMIKEAFMEIQSSGIKNLAVAVNLDTNEEKTQESIVRTLHKMIHQAEQHCLSLIFCFRHEAYNGSFTPKYIIPKNTAAFCKWIEISFALKFSGKDIYFEMSSYLKTNRDNYLVGISYREYDEIINRLPIISTTKNPYTIEFGESPDNKIAAKGQILNEYDFIITEGADLLFACEFRKDSRDLYITCTEAKKPIIKTIPSCNYGHFAGTSHVLCYSYVSGAQKYIFNDSWDILLKNISYQNLKSAVKTLQIELKKQKDSKH